MNEQNPALPGYEANNLWWYNHLRHTATEKYDNNKKDWYFRFDYNNKMNYKYLNLNEPVMLWKVINGVHLPTQYVFTSRNNFKVLNME